MGKDFGFDAKVELNLIAVAKAIWDWLWNSKFFQVIRQAIGFIKHLKQVFPKIKEIAINAFKTMKDEVKGFKLRPLLGIGGRVDKLINAFKGLNLGQKIENVIKQQDEAFLQEFEEIQEIPSEHQEPLVSSTKLMQSRDQAKAEPKFLLSIADWLKC